jgi:hypothetical protein
MKSMGCGRILGMRQPLTPLTRRLPPPMLKCSFGQTGQGMSRIQINRYLAELDRTKKFSGSLTEEVIRDAFKGLLKDWSAD